MCLSPVTIKNANYGAFVDNASVSYVADNNTIAMALRSPRYYDKVSYRSNGVTETYSLRNSVEFQRSASDNYSTRYLSLKDCTNRFISVPCGSCSECASQKQNYFSQRAFFQARSSAVFMCTLTASDDFMKYYDIDFHSDPSICDRVSKVNVDVPYQFYSKYVRKSNSDVYDDDSSDLPAFYCEGSPSSSVSSVSSVSSHSSDVFPYLPYSYIQNFMKRLRKRGFLGDFKYSLCYEFGGKKRRPHFHVLFYCPFTRFAGETLSQFSNRMKLFAQTNAYKVWNEWAVNIGGRKFPVYKHISIYKISGSLRQPFDFHYVDPYNSKNGVFDTSVFYYTSKYLFKYSDWFNRLNLKVKYFSDNDYREWRRTCCPRSRTSKFLGMSSDVMASVCDMVRKSFQYIGNAELQIKSPLFFCSNGETSPLSPYYLRKLPADLYLSFFSALKASYGVTSSDWPRDFIECSRSDVARKLSRSSRILACVAISDNIL